MAIKYTCSENKLFQAYQAWEDGDENVTLCCSYVECDLHGDDQLEALVGLATLTGEDAHEYGAKKVLVCDACYEGL